MKSYTWLIVLGIIVAILGLIAVVGGGGGGWKTLLIGAVAALAGWNMNRTQRS